MRRSFFQALILFVLLALPAVLLVLKWRQEADDGESPVAPHAAEVAVERADDPAGSPEAVSSEVPQATPDDADGEGLPAFFEEWESALSAKERGGRALALKRWRDAVLALPREEAVRRLVAYWRSGRDLTLGLPFAPGPEGAMQTAPTLRTAVLDLLGRLDPATAFALAQEAFAAPKDSADEYALHLRNYAWGAPESFDPAEVRAFLVEQTVAMLEHPAWRAAPTEGYQEAFDVFVWAQATEVLPALLPMMEPTADAALRRPAAIVLERFAVERPVAVLQSIVNAPERWRDVGSLAAGLAARANLATPTERDLAESYFLAPEREAAERDRFLGMLPNLNLTMSYNLLSETPSAFAVPEVIERLQGAEATLADWAEDPRFRAWSPEIRETLERLRAHLADVP
jgi:hypothetical protein